MSHVIVPNQPPGVASANDYFTQVWKLTRALLAAGWKYKGSGDATAGGTKDTSGSFISDKWGVGGGVNLATNVQTGTTSDAMTANTDGTMTHVVTGATFTASSVGRFLTVSGAVTASNNGTFRIVAFTSSTTIKVYNPSQTSETTTVTWTEKSGGANGTISTAGTGAATVGRAIFTVGSGSPFVVPTASPVNRGSTGDRLTIIGGAVGANNGHFVITRVISTTAVEIENSAATSSGETNNGTLTWVQVSPTAQTQPGTLLFNVGTGAWINLQGPSTMKIPVGTNVPTGAFLKGEVVTQTGSGATGTILGVLTDTSGGLGYLVVEPRLNGTGTGPRGWNSATNDTVSAVAAPAGSGATITTTANGTTVLAIEFVREIVLWKSTQTAGHYYAQVVDQAVESASRYSVVAAAAGTTNVICPGGATGAFPTAGSFVVAGTGASNAVGTGAANWFQNSANLATQGLAQIMCANCIETSAAGADGSFLILTGQPATNPFAYAGNGFQRCEDQEDGDVDPYVYMAFGAASNYGGARTVYVTNSAATDWWAAGTLLAPVSYTPYRGWRRRGFATGDAYQDFQGAILGSHTSTVIVNNNTLTPGRVANSFTTQFVKEPLWIVSTQNLQKMRKGNLRWVFVTEGANGGQTLQNGTYFMASSNIAGAAMVGPWDGTSIPMNG